ncbi:hypothetical protein CcI6DRAFT_03813 [Frankia sp. CcI6]|nr:hypothetical protein CcI6DRAFT_03813 [Frankia sp. CcI6]KFB03319.1 hypothetical protein ALLO2DRAFT_03914 [Frankia sp. Allo2]OAA21308.1 hypothetical protein AAY23_107911 [Frankia casuarinae]
MPAKIAVMSQQQARTDSLRKLQTARHALPSGAFQRPSPTRNRCPAPAGLPHAGDLDRHAGRGPYPKTTRAPPRPSGGAPTGSAPPSVVRTPTPGSGSGPGPRGRSTDWAVSRPARPTTDPPAAVNRGPARPDPKRHGTPGPARTASPTRQQDPKDRHHRRRSRPRRPAEPGTRNQRHRRDWTEPARPARPAGTGQNGGTRGTVRRRRSRPLGDGPRRGWRLGLRGPSAGHGPAALSLCGRWHARAGQPPYHQPPAVFPAQRGTTSRSIWP